MRDSLIAAVLADTLDSDAAVDSMLASAPRPALRQTFTVRPTVRHFSIGGVDANEQASAATWQLRRGRASLRLDLTPVSYSGDTSATAGRPPVDFSGASPVGGRFDLRVGRADTLRVYGQSASFPGTLPQVDAQAIGAVGTSTIDLDAGALGMAARVGTRYAHTRLIGPSHTVALSLRGAVEYEPRPSGTQSVSWRGTTLRGGAGLSRAVHDMTFSAEVDLSRSFSDSLGGRNLFPGGGSVSADVQAMRFMGEDGADYVSLSGFYSRPIGMERPDQPTRLIPIGDYSGLTATAALSVGDVTLVPLLSIARETSHATAIVNARRTTAVTASGYTSTASLAVAVPVGGVVTITPEVGGAFGSVGQTVSITRVRIPVTRSASFRDRIRGGWFALEVSLSR